MQKEHTDFKVEKCGLFLSPSYPYLGATPDGVTWCKCCDSGILEVKCPFCFKDATLDVAASSKSFCLEMVNGLYDLKKDHPYYYQIQAQLHVSDKPHCDFVVWTSKNLYIKRLFKDTPFFMIQLEKVEHFFKVGVLPELLGKWTTRKCSELSTTNASVCCYCKEKEEGTVVVCGNTNCEIEKFHLKCLGLKRRPKKGWRCIDCRKTVGKENDSPY